MFARIDEVGMETRVSMANNAEEILAKARDLSSKPDLLKKALEFARESKIRYIQLGDEYLEKQRDAAAVVDELERRVALGKMATFEQELEDVRSAARRWGTCPESDIPNEKIGRLQTGLWLEFQKRASLNIWNKEGQSARRNLDAGMSLVVNEYAKKLLEYPDIKKVELTEVYKVLGSDPVVWVVRLSIVASWGKRSFLIAF